MCYGDGEARKTTAVPSSADVSACFAYSKQKESLIPIYHWQKAGGAEDHFYTADLSPGITLEDSENYVEEGVAWYIFPSRERWRRTLPLSRWYNPTTGTHSYVVDGTGLLPPKIGCRKEATLGFVIVGTIPPPGTISLPLPVLTPTADFTFDPIFSDEQRYLLLREHQKAYDRAGVCNSISHEAADSVRARYLERIHHDITTDASVNASAFVGGSVISINTANLLTLPPNEIAQTLLHEMLHCVGYSHPLRTSADTPFDNGPYYGSVPLQGELCIAGNQSLTGAAQTRPCTAA